MKRKIKESRGTVFFRCLIRLFLLAWSIIVVFPVLWVLYTSLKTNEEFMTKPWSLPSVPQWSNFAEAWEKAKFGSYFFNSLFTVIFTLIITLIIVGASAYAIAKFGGRFIKGLEKFYMISMMAPAVLMLIPLYYFADSLYMTDSLFWLSVIYAIQGMPFSVFLLVGFIRGINNSLIEAATIDGASQYTVFFKIIMPLVKPALFTVGLLNAHGMNISPRSHF